MKNLITIIAAAAAVFGATNISMAREGGDGGGRLNAPEPFVRDVNVPVKLEQGYISQDQINADNRGTTRSENSPSR